MSSLVLALDNPARRLNQWRSVWPRLLAKLPCNLSYRIAPRAMLRASALASPRPPIALLRKVLVARRDPEYAFNMAMPRTEPAELHEHAMDNLRYIRRTLERAGSFTAVPGYGGVVMGLVALAAARFAARRAAVADWLLIWMAAAAIALAIGIVGAALKSRRFQMPLFSGPGRKFIAGFAPAILAGAVLTLVLYRAGVSGFLPGVWLLLYGAAVLSGGWASVRVVPLMGACFMLVGAMALLLPGYNDELLSVGFGGLHLVFGIVIAVKYGG